MYTIHNIILDKAYKSSIISINLSFNIKTSEELQLYKNAARDLYQFGLINLEQDNTITITPLGKKVYTGEGIEPFLLNLEKRELKLKQKENFDFQISRFQSKTKYFPYIISFLSFIIALLAYFKPLKSTEKKQLLKNEIIQILDSISFSNQTKMVDSLHNPKNPSDSLKIN